MTNVVSCLLLLAFLSIEKAQRTETRGSSNAGGGGSFGGAGRSSSGFASSGGFGRSSGGLGSFAGNGRSGGSFGTASSRTDSSNSLSGKAQSGGQGFLSSTKNALSGAYSATKNAISGAYNWAKDGLKNVFSSSQTNRNIAERMYPNSWPERTVATYTGDKLPKMRDDLAQRKQNGEGFLRRHYNAWTTRDNWSIDPKFREKQAADPWKGGPFAKKEASPAAQPKFDRTDQSGNPAMTPRVSENSPQLGPTKGDLKTVIDTFKPNEKQAQPTDRAIEFSVLSDTADRSANSASPQSFRPLSLLKLLTSSDTAKSSQAVSNPTDELAARSPIADSPTSKPSAAVPLQTEQHSQAASKSSIPAVAVLSPVASESPGNSQPALSLYSGSQGPTSQTAQDVGHAAPLKAVVAGNESRNNGNPLSRTVPESATSIATSVKMFTTTVPRPEELLHQDHSTAGLDVTTNSISTTNNNGGNIGNISGGSTVALTDAPEPTTAVAPSASRRKAPAFTFVHAEREVNGDGNHGMSAPLLLSKLPTQTTTPAEPTTAQPDEFHATRSLLINVLA